MNDGLIYHSHYYSKFSYLMWLIRTKWLKVLYQMLRKLDHISIGKRESNEWKINRGRKRAEKRKKKKTKLKLSIFAPIRQYRRKDVSEFSTDKKFVIFRSIQKYIFDEEASAPLTENDNLVVLNVQLNVSISFVFLFFWFSLTSI